jgi:hypothetical protein
MAKSKFDTSFEFGANLTRKKGTSGGKKKSSKRKPTAAQKASAALYVKPRRR